MSESEILAERLRSEIELLQDDMTMLEKHGRGVLTDAERKHKWLVMMAIVAFVKEVTNKNPAH